MRCRIREEPWGSHHDDASAEKCESSVWLTDDVFEAGRAVDGDWVVGAVVDAADVE